MREDLVFFEIQNTFNIIKKILKLSSKSFEQIVVRKGGVQVQSVPGEP